MQEEPDPIDGPDEAPPLPERRQHDRVPVRLEIRFARTIEAARALRAYSLNLSAGGLCLRTQKAHEVGAPLLLAVTVDQLAFQLTGTVAWVRSGAIGVRFEGLSKEDRLRLTEMMESLKRQR